MGRFYVHVHVCSHMIKFVQKYVLMVDDVMIRIYN